MTKASVSAFPVPTYVLRNRLHGVDQVLPLYPYISEETDNGDDSGSTKYECFHPGDADGLCIILKTVTAIVGDVTTITRTVATATWALRADGGTTYTPINGSDYRETPDAE